MRLFSRRQSEDFASPVGTLQCSERGCREATAILCSYHDRRGRNCDTAFCREHWSMVGGVVYCRRHAGTVVALGDSTQTGAFPELENRGPSLVSWIANDLTHDVEAILRKAARHRETVKTETELAVVFDSKHQRRWERSWKLMEPTGITVKVAVSVSEEGDDALVDVRVGSNVIARGVPPWIARRRAGLTVAPGVDSAQRELYHRFFIDHISEEVALQRSASASLIG